MPAETPSEPINGTHSDLFERGVERDFALAFLAQAFSYPTAEVWPRLESAMDDFARAWKKLLPEGDTVSFAQAVSGAKGRLAELGAVHNALFATGLAAPARETAYELDKTARRAAELADIQGFYKAFGVELSAPIEADSVIAELEFASMLVHKEAHARLAGDSDGATICADAYQAFLADHLGRWYRIFAEKVKTATDDPYYRAAAGLLALILDQETRRLGCPPDQPRGDEEEK